MSSEVIRFLGFVMVSLLMFVGVYLVAAALVVDRDLLIRALYVISGLAMIQLGRVMRRSLVAKRPW